MTGNWFDKEIPHNICVISLFIEEKYRIVHQWCDKGTDVEERWRQVKGSKNQQLFMFSPEWERAQDGDLCPKLKYVTANTPDNCSQFDFSGVIFLFLALSVPVAAYQY